MKPALLRIEIERILNLVRGYGWVKAEEKVFEDKITLTLSKKLPPTEGEE